MISDGIPAAAPVSRLVDEFHKLPGIGPKTAQRLTYFLVRIPDDQARSLPRSITPRRLSTKPLALMPTPTIRLSPRL